MNTIYLAGHVPKGKDEEEKFSNWRKEYAPVLKECFSMECVDPWDRTIDEGDPMQVFGADCNHIKESAFVVVNAENKLGVGTSQEMVIAKHFHKTIVTVLPKDTHHRRQNLMFNGVLVKDWIHPFVHAFSDVIIEDIRDIGKSKEEILKVKPKTLSIIEEGIAHFKKKST